MRWILLQTPAEISLLLNQQKRRHHQNRRNSRMVDFHSPKFTHISKMEDIPAVFFLVRRGPSERETGRWRNWRCFARVDSGQSMGTWSPVTSDFISPASMVWTPAYGTAVLINFGSVQSVATVIDVASSTVYIANYYFFYIMSQNVQHTLQTIILLTLMSQNTMLLEGSHFHDMVPIFMWFYGSRVPKTIWR